MKKIILLSILGFTFLFVKAQSSYTGIFHSPDTAGMHTDNSFNLRANTRATEINNWNVFHKDGSRLFTVFFGKKNPYIQVGLTKSTDLFVNGNVGIGTTRTGTHKLAVEGTIGAREMKVSTNLLVNGNVGIGTTKTGTHKLAVEGTIGAREIKVEAGAWSDFVFAEDYTLRNLEEVESYIEENNHLPDMPSEKEVQENGIQLGEMDAKLLQKIEELTLYMIEQNKDIKELKEKIEKLEMAE